MIPAEAFDPEDFPAVTGSQSLCPVCNSVWRYNAAMDVFWCPDCQKRKPSAWLRPMSAPKAR